MRLIKRVKVWKAVFVGFIPFCLSVAVSYATHELASPELLVLSLQAPFRQVNRLWSCRCRKGRHALRISNSAQEVIGVLIFSALPFTAVQTLADSKLGKSLRVRPELQTLLSLSQEETVSSSYVAVAFHTRRFCIVPFLGLGPRRHTSAKLCPGKECKVILEIKRRCLQENVEKNKPRFEKRSREREKQQAEARKRRSIACSAFQNRGSN